MSKPAKKPPREPSTRPAPSAPSLPNSNPPKARKRRPPFVL